MAFSLFLATLIIILIYIIFLFIVNFIRRVKDVQKGKIIIPPVPTTITTKDANTFIRFALAIVILLFMSGFLYFSNTSSMLVSTFGKIGLALTRVLLFLLAYFI